MHTHVCGVLYSQDVIGLYGAQVKVIPFASNRKVLPYLDRFAGNSRIVYRIINGFLKETLPQIG